MWIAENVPKAWNPDEIIVPSDHSGEYQEIRQQWQTKICRKGWLAPTWRREYGGIPGDHSEHHRRADPRPAEVGQLERREKQMETKGKTAVVTGGASGLGAATAQRLYANGANIVVVDFNEEGGQAFVRQLGDRGLFAKADVTVTEQLQAAVQAAMAKFGRIDILINCAGTGFAQRTVSKEGPADMEIFKKIVAINLFGTYDMIRLCAWEMTKNQPGEDGERGVIVNTASAAAFEGQIGQAAYSASKAGVVGLTLTVARDLASLGIRVCTIAPGTFDTPLLSRLPENVKISLGEQNPFPRRLGKANEYAMLAHQIVENTMLNGETIRLDGAIRMQPK